MKRITRYAGIITLALLLSACGGVFSSLRLAIASAAPLIKLAVARGLINEAKAEDLRTDLNALIDVTEKMDKGFKVAQTKAAKLLVVQTGANEYAAIIGAGHFVNVPWLNDAMQIIDGIFDTLLAFYGGSESKDITFSSSGAPKTEKALADYLKHETERLKEKLKVDNLK